MERRFYERAVGYTYEAVKVFMPSGAAEPVYPASFLKLPQGGDTFHIVCKCGLRE